MGEKGWGTGGVAFACLIDVGSGLVFFWVSFSFSPGNLASQQSGIFAKNHEYNIALVCFVQLGYNSIQRYSTLNFSFPLLFSRSIWIWVTCTCLVAFTKEDKKRK